MRLRLTVRRHGLPETPIIWTVDIETSTISQLLEQVNDAIPIESGDWGFEDYAVELKGSNGVNYECLHYQVVGKVFKEDDEIIIRPLLTQDIKIRRVSGRNQISADGKHLLDGLAFGRPLLRRPADRPPVNIPPLKRRRITYDEPIEDDDDDEGFKALKEKEEAMKEDSDKENGERQLVIHADFDDTDSEDDEDFEPGEDDEVEGSVEEEDSVVEEEESESDEEEQWSDEAKEVEKAATKSQSEDDDSDDADESGLRGVPNKRRTMIRKLHLAFPASTIAICKYILDGTEGDLDEAYEAMAIGFIPKVYKGAITETSQETLNVPKTRSKKRKAVMEEPEDQDSMQVEMDESINPLVDHYDKHGLPPGSIASGRALSAMAEVMQSTPGKPQPTSRSSATSGKRMKFSQADSFTNGLTSTPFIDRKSQVQGEQDDDEVSSETSSSGSSSEEEEVVQISDDTSTSGSDSDSSDSSSESESDSDEAPEETSSKPSSAVSHPPQKLQKFATQGAVTKQQSDKIPPGAGKNQTRARNTRRRNANTLNRFKEKGILPAGTTTNELIALRGVVDYNSSAENVLDALEGVRSSKRLSEAQQLTGRGLAKANEFEARRQALLDSIESGGIDVVEEFSQGSSKPYFVAREDNEAILIPSTTSTPSKRFSKSPSTALEVPDLSVKPTRASKSPSKALDKSEVSSTPARASTSPSKESSASITPSKTLDIPKRSITTARQLKSPSNVPSLSGTLSRLTPTSPLGISEVTPALVASSSESNINVDINEPVANAFPIAPESQQRNSTGENSQIPTGEMAETLRASPAANEATPEISSQSKAPTPTGSARSSDTPARRAKLDLSASRRLLFGGLGMRAPKTKQDEDKLRNDMMKGVRPLITSKPVEEAQPEETVYEDPDAWREKINYRAVECVQEGVELSEPPFPFVQRWDPQQRWDSQQQGGWTHKGKRGGKRKQDLRDQSQFYEGRSPKKQKQPKGKHSYDEQQEYLEASYEPSYQEDSMDVSYDEPTQESRLDEDDDDISKQITNDLNEAVSAADSQPPEDLAPLPKDPSTLPDLAEGQAKVGMTIAFKQLDFGEHTGWSPLVSPWRTAIVVSAPEDADLHLCLALRDRRQPKKNFDQETGKRVYGRFEVPDEDEEEDDGTLDIEFKQLRGPKVLQDAPLNLETGDGLVEKTQNNGDRSTDDSVTMSHEHEEHDESTEAQLSHVTETQLHSDSPDVPDFQDTQPTPQSHKPEHLEIQQSQIEAESVAEVPVNEESAANTVGNNESGNLEAPPQETPAEQDHQIEENSHNQYAEPIQPEDIANQQELTSDPLPQNASEPKLITRKAEDNANGDSGFSSVRHSDEMTSACPTCNASLDGAIPDLASRHTNGCLDGNPVPLPEPAVQIAPTIPADTTLTNEVDMLAEPVSEETRQEISKLMKDAGFRSSIASLEDIRPDGMESPGDAAVFDKLMKDMTDTNNETPYSPKYIGLGTSPSPDPQQPASSLAKYLLQSSSPAVPQSSWQTVDSQLPSSPRAENRVRPSSPGGHESSWQTIDSSIPSSPPVVNEPEIEPQVEEQDPEEDEDEGSWESVEDPVSPPIKKSKKKRPSRVSEILKNANFGAAEAMWEPLHGATGVKERKESPAPSQARSRQASVLSTQDFSRKLQSATPQGKNHSNSVASNIKARQQSPVPGSQELPQKSSISSVSQSQSPPVLDLPGLDGAGEIVITPTVRYPKLSAGSSFTSQISDHGRQPDNVFDETAELNADTPKAGYFDDSFNLDDAMLDIEPELSIPIGDKVDITQKRLEEQLSDDAPEPESRKPINPTSKSKKEPSKRPVIRSDEDSSDAFPSLAELASQASQRSRSRSQSHVQVKDEKPTASTVFKATKENKLYQKEMDALDDLSEDEEEQSTPKVSQTKRRPLFKAKAVKPPPAPQTLDWSRGSNSRASQDRGSHSRASVSRDPQSRGSQSNSRPAASQAPKSTQDIVDLTQDSELESDHDSMPDHPLATFRAPQLFEHDEDYEEPSFKRASSQKVETRRHTSGSGSLRASLQAALNTKTVRENSRF